MTPGIQTVMRAQEKTWDEHNHALLVDHDADAALHTMAAEPYVLHVPIMVGGHGRDAVRSFYADQLVAHLPEDLGRTPISRTADQFRLVDEAVQSFTHDRELPWLAPGIQATGNTIELVVIEVVGFVQGKIARRRLLWDHSSLLVQLGLLDGAALPPTGAEPARWLRTLGRGRSTTAWT